jgi:hypothetical protein
VSRDASSVHNFAGELRAFRLGLAEWEKIDETCGYGPTGAAVLLKRTAIALQAVAQANIAVLAGVNHRDLARTEDVRTVILWGLVGGGMGLLEADKLVRLWVDGRPLMETIDLAYLVVMPTLLELKDDPVGEDAAGEGTGNPNSLAGA